MRRGAPFAGYEDFDDCTSQNSGKDDPDAYCGEIKHRTEDKGSKKTGASSLPQIQQVTDPNNNEVPEDDQLPEGVMFPVDPAFSARWVTGPQGARPQGQPQQKESAARALPQAAALQWGYSHALEGGSPMHKADWQYSPQRHGDYLRSWNNTAGVMHGMMGRAALSRQEYGEATGRPDLHKQYLAAYAEGRRRNVQGSPYQDIGESEGQITAMRRRADSWSEPRESTDDFFPPYNSQATTPPMTQPSGDYQAGMQAGKADRASGQRPAFADNSSGVSAYVKGYAEGYGGTQAPRGAGDVPYSMGGDSGQAGNAQEAQKAFQVARASRRVSASFAPDMMMGDPAFRRGYRTARAWRKGRKVASRGSAPFEAGLYAGITDAGPAVQRAWLAAHAAAAPRRPELGRRIELHRSFTRKHARKRKMRVQGSYLRTSGTTTDLITDGPGTSPDPMGSTSLNGPGTPPPMAGRDNANAPGGAPPYQGAPPQGSGPVVPDEVMGRSQEAPQPSGPFTNTFSGNHPGNVTLAPVAPNSAAQPGYTNKDAYSGDPRGGDRLAAFRRTVQANLAKMGAAQ